MKVKELSFGTINIDGKDYFKDIVINKGKIKKRKKKEWPYPTFDIRKHPLGLQKAYHRHWSQLCPTSNERS